MRQQLALFVLLGAFWLLLSGIYTPLLLTFGGICAAVVTLLARRMDAVDGAHYWTPLNWLKVPGYLAWLSREVLVANLDVMRRVLAPSLPISPTIVDVDVAARTDMGRVLFANCVTLTPGTLAVNVDGDRLLVHALSAEGAAALADGDMGDRVAALEAAPANAHAADRAPRPN